MIGNVAKVLVVLAVLSFLLAIYVVIIGPISYLQAESFSRASSNLTLIAIALFLWDKGSNA